MYTIYSIYSYTCVCPSPVVPSPPVAPGNNPVEVPPNRLAPPNPPAWLVWLKSLPLLLLMHLLPVQDQLLIYWWGRVRTCLLGIYQRKLMYQCWISYHHLRGKEGERERDHEDIQYTCMQIRHKALWTLGSVGVNVLTIQSHLQYPLKAVWVD